MKRILGVLISSVMLAVSCLTAMPVSAKEEYTEYIVPFYSDQTKQRQVLGMSNKSLLKDGVVLIPLETACEIAGASIAAENDEAVIITRNYVSWCCEYEVEKNQHLLVDSNTGKGNFYKSALKCLTESSWLGVSFKYSLDNEGIINLPVDSSYPTDVPCEYYKNKLYVSFYDFLVMMGVNVKIANKATQAELVKPFFNAMGISANENTIDELINYIYLQVMGDCDAEIFFSCRLGTPIDKLYMDYYETQSEVYMCDLTDYYTDGDVKWANLVNSAASFNGLTETALAAMNMNTDYSEALVNVVSNVGGNWKNSEDSKSSLQDIAFLLQYGWDSESLSLGLIENMEDIAGIVSNTQGSKFTGIDLGISDGISIAFGAYTTGLEYYDKYNALDTLFENDKKLLKNSILNSEHMKQAASDEYGDDFFSKLGNFLGRGAVINKDLLNTSNSYINLYRSAVEVQSLIETSAPATWGAIQKAYKGAASATLDTVILKTIDGFAFSGVPVTELAVQFVQLLSKRISKTAYVEQQSKIAEFDDYIFIQEVAKGCFDDYSLGSENAFSTFVLGIKASMTAYEAENEQNKSKKIQGRLECLEKMLSDTTFANRNYYRIGAKGCADLTGMLGGNTDISKLDTTPRQDITLEFGEETNEPTKSETINYEEIYYEYLINNFEIAELVDDDVYSHSSWNEKMHGLISATIHDFNNDDILELLTVSSEKSPEHSEFTAIYLNLYQYNSENVVFVDKIGLNEYSADGQSSDSVRLSISGNAIYQEMDTNGRYASMGIGSSAHEYSVISVSDYSFNKYSLFTDTVNIIDISQNSSLYHNGVYDNDLLYHDEEKCNQLKSEQWYYCDNKHYNYNLDYILNTVQNKYSDFGLAFSSLNIDKNNLNDCITVSTSLEGAVPLCSLERMYPKLEIIDYTNLRGHISARVIDYEEIYYSYIENELIPKYGLASLNQFEIDQNENNSMPNTSYGIVSADIDDYDNDNSKELIVLTLEPSEQEKFYCDINLHLYSIEDNKVKYADSEYLYGYQMYDIHSDNFFTLDKCNNKFLFTNNVCYFSGEAASSNVTIIKIVNSNFVSENMTTSDYEGEKLYVNGNEVCNSNDDVNFYEMIQRILSQKLIENGFSFDNVEYKGRSINVSVTNNTKIAKYSATFDSSSANWFSVISPNDFTNLRDQISQLEETPVNTFDIKNYCGKYVSTDLPILIEITKTEDSDVGIYVEIWNNSVTRQSSSKIIAKTTSNPFMYETSDSHGNTNSYTLEFGKDRIILNAECIDYGGSWSIPIVTNAVLQKETLFGSTTSWQQLYADELRKYINSDNYYTDTMFELMDIDNNNVPELFISEMSAHVGQVLVYTIHNGKLIFLGDYGEYGYVSYNSEKSLMWSGYFNHGRGFESHYRLENGTLVEMFSCETNSAAIVDENEVYYMINGENVSKSEFETKREENTFDGWVKVGRKHSLDESTINSVLLSSGTRMGIIITENDALNVRQSPSTESNKIGTVGKGSTVIIRSEVDGWYEIEFNGNSGYVSGEYVQIVE